MVIVNIKQDKLNLIELGITCDHLNIETHNNMNEPSVDYKAGSWNSVSLSKQISSQNK